MYQKNDDVYYDLYKESKITLKELKQLPELEGMSDEELQALADQPRSHRRPRCRVLVLDRDEIRMMKLDYLDEVLFRIYTRKYHALLFQ